MGWSYLLCDRWSDVELADLSELALTKKTGTRLNRPISTVVTIPGDTAELRDSSYDGVPNLAVGHRTIKAYQDGILRAHTIVWNVSPSGDENTTLIDVTGYDPLIQFQKRPVRDDTGAFANPSFPSPISGAEILQAAIENSISYDGDLGIDLTGPIASATDLAADLTNWPILLADLLTTLTNTGALDVQIRPVDTHTGFAAGTLGQLVAAEQIGSDLTGSVNFDYATGDYSVSAIRRSFDMDELCNKLWYYLGPRYDDTHYRSNITATETTPVDLSAYLALEEASRALYGTLMDIQIFDDTDAESAARPLFHRLWETEVALRVNPRELLFVTPARGDGCPFRPFVDYNPGDLVAVNAADIVGPAVSGASQRVYGFDVTVDEDGVETVSELVVSADGT